MPHVTVFTTQVQRVTWWLRHPLDLSAAAEILVEALQACLLLGLPLFGQLLLDVLHPGCLVSALHHTILDPLPVCAHGFDAPVGQTLLHLDPHLKLHCHWKELDKLHLLPLCDAESLLALEADAFQHGIDLGSAILLNAAGEPLRSLPLLRRSRGLLEGLLRSSMAGRRHTGARAGRVCKVLGVSKLPGETAGAGDGAVTVIDEFTKSQGWWCPRIERLFQVTNHAIRSQIPCGLLLTLPKL
mmetsp:Transcript_6819/g.16121  ORF Transcript_6819/g.16121 Transcript_6819/m.16121 type:complete len:242 (+) Transcript_6819:23-748(+)